MLPITDPYVVHHAALGSACWVHVAEQSVERGSAVLETVDGVEEVLTRDDAAVELSLPADRIGDLVVLGDAGDRASASGQPTTISRRLRGPLRSHGGRHEQEIPILLSDEPGALEPARCPRNADVHSLVLGGRLTGGGDRRPASSLPCLIGGDEGAAANARRGRYPYTGEIIGSAPTLRAQTVIARRPRPAGERDGSRSTATSAAACSSASPSDRRRHATSSRP